MHVDRFVGFTRTADWARAFMDRRYFLQVGTALGLGAAGPAFVGARQSTPSGFGYTAGPEVFCSELNRTAPWALAGTAVRETAVVASDDRM